MRRPNLQYTGPSPVRRSFAKVLTERPTWRAALVASKAEEVVECISITI